jgi:two-component system cell cycle sensor histidine kinase/response regulator CckA
MTEPHHRPRNSDASGLASAARLIVLRGEHVGRRISVTGTLVLGRGHDAQVQFEESGISRHHARITALDGGRYEIEDLGSRNGIKVNGTAVTKASLAFGDEIQLGANITLRLVPRDPVEEHALQQQRLQALGRLAAGVAHDVNNMLGAIGANVDWLRGLPDETVVSGTEVHECLADIATAALRAAELTRGVISFARGQGQGRARVDLSALAGEVLRLLRHALPQQVELRSNVAPGVHVVGNRVELHQVLMNLCLNARDAMPDGGALTVEISFQPASALEGLPLMTRGPHARVTVADTGIGMDPATLRRVFEPFFSTKGEGAGFGLGLATVREVVSSHQGYIAVESAVGRGAVFTLYLPALLGGQKDRWMSATVEQGAPPRGQDPTLGSCVLVVDDEAVVQRSIGRLLKRAGYEVVLASTGREALDHYEHARRRPNLILLDMDMPGLSGEDTLTALRRFDPAVKVLVMSGDPERSALIEGALGVVGKPSDAPTLIEAVRSALLDEPADPPTRPR